MNFAKLINIHNKIEKKHPKYQKCLAHYEITDMEKESQKINPNNVEITSATGYIINGKFIEDDYSGNIIFWDDFLMLPISHNEGNTINNLNEIAEKILYCLYLYAIDNFDSRSELRKIFSGEKLESKYFAVDCDDEYNGLHYINNNGQCICNNFKYNSIFMNS